MVYVYTQDARFVGEEKRRTAESSSSLKPAISSADGQTGPWAGHQHRKNLLSRSWSTSGMAGIYFSFALHNIEFSCRPQSEPGHLVIRTKLGLFALPFGGQLQRFDNITAPPLCALLIRTVEALLYYQMHYSNQPKGRAKRPNFVRITR